MSGATRYTSALDEDRDNPNDRDEQIFAELLIRKPGSSRNPALHDEFPDAMDERQRVLAEFAAMLEEAFFCPLPGKPAKRLKLRLTNGPFAGLLIEAEQEENSPSITIRLFPDRQHGQRFLRTFGRGAELAASLSEMFHHPITIEVRDSAPQAKFDADPSIK
jgi:hypothetical protein